MGATTEGPRVVSALPDVLQPLLERFRAGQRMALARAISLVEGERPGFESFLHAALADGLRADRVGFTGPPGAGKSSLVARVASAYREQDASVGIVAVDPTSPFSGGALLGDRIRMNELATDPGVFIRSMATRGSLGGLAAATREVMDLMDSFGMSRLIVETVGVGQTELEITSAADTVVVVLVPESGDSIQAMKAGLMEIADIFVVNKADRPGADRLAKEVRLALHLRAGEAMKGVPAHHGVDLGKVPSGGSGPADLAADLAADVAADVAAGLPNGVDADKPDWEIPVLKTVAQTGDGVDELIDTISMHQSYLRKTTTLQLRRRLRAGSRVRDVVQRQLSRRIWKDDGAVQMFEAGLDSIQRGDATPYSVAALLIERMIAGDGGKK